jgi:hypothetical protein
MATSKLSEHLLSRIACVCLAVSGAVAVALVIRAKLAEYPPAAGFDLDLILAAARRVAGGGSPYDAQVATTVESYFYSYPPWVAQVLVPVSGLPTWLVLTASSLGAVAGLALIAALLPRSPIGRPVVAVPGLSLDAALLALGLAPITCPFAAGLLFGNVDVWYPLLFGALVLAVAPRGGDGPAWRTSLFGGAGLAIAAAVKLQPATLIVWLASRSPKKSAPQRWLLATAVAAIVMSAAIGALSVLAAGFGPWREYLAYMQLGDPGLAHQLAPLVAILAVVSTVVVARVVDDPLESVGWAIVASLMVLPLTWYHYQVALLPVALAAWTRSRGSIHSKGVNNWLLAALVVADAAMLLPVAVWIAAALVLIAVRLSGAQLRAGHGAAGLVPGRPAL